jgi:hypothetical protein
MSHDLQLIESFRQSLDENRGWAWKIKIAAV